MVWHSRKSSWVLLHVNIVRTQVCFSSLHLGDLELVTEMWQRSIIRLTFSKASIFLIQRQNETTFPGLSAPVLEHDWNPEAYDTKEGVSCPSTAGF